MLKITRKTCNEHNFDGMRKSVKKKKNTRDFTRKMKNGNDDANRCHYCWNVGYEIKFIRRNVITYKGHLQYNEKTITAVLTRQYYTYVVKNIITHNDPYFNGRMEKYNNLGKIFFLTTSNARQLKKLPVVNFSIKKDVILIYTKTNKIDNVLSKNFKNLILYVFELFELQN